MINSATDTRISSSTKYNQNSSRSHAIFQIKLINLTTKKENIISIIDLAGSERTCTESNKDKTYSEKEKLLQKETNFINKSLTTLGRIFKILSDKKLKNTHLPYRDSKLTMVLHVILCII